MKVRFQYEVKAVGPRATKPSKKRLPPVTLPFKLDMFRENEDGLGGLGDGEVDSRDWGVFEPLRALSRDYADILFSIFCQTESPVHMVAYYYLNGKSYSETIRVQFPTFDPKFLRG